MRNLSSKLVGGISNLISRRNKDDVFRTLPQSIRICPAKRWRAELGYTQ